MRRSRKVVIVASVLAGLVCLNYAPVAWGSMFGEENVTLAQILVETFKITEEMQDLNEAADITADVITDVRDTYQQVNAGIDEMKNYTSGRFLDDLQEDVSSTYPGLAHLAGASGQLKFWDDLHGTQSPFSAYEMVTAVTGDLSADYRQRIRDGRVNVDYELIQATEAADSWAMANKSLEATNTFDQEIARLSLEADNASPGKAEQVTAHAMVTLAAQQSYVMRLLARTVQTDGVDRALQYRTRMQSRDRASGLVDDSGSVFKKATEPVQMLDFTDLE